MNLKRFNELLEERNFLQLYYEYYRTSGKDVLTDDDFVNSIRKFVIAHGGDLAILRNIAQSSGWSLSVVTKQKGDVVEVLRLHAYVNDIKPVENEIKTREIEGS